MTLSTISTNTSNRHSFWIKLVITILVSTITAAWLVYRDTTEPPRLTSEQFSKMSLAQSIQEIADTTVKGGAPGVVIVVRKDGLETIATAGVSNKLTADKISATQPLRIASVSKVYTATVILW